MTFTPGFAWISIHTPARGVTMVTGLLAIICDISIHTPARGVTWRKVTWH